MGFHTRSQPKRQRHPSQGCIRREWTSEAAPEAVRQAVGGGCRSGWGRLLSVTIAIEPGTWCVRGTVAGHRLGALGGYPPPPLQCNPGPSPRRPRMRAPSPRGVPYQNRPTAAVHLPNSPPNRVPNARCTVHSSQALVPSACSQPHTPLCHPPPTPWGGAQVQPTATHPKHFGLAPGGGGGVGMTPWCDDLVCSWRRLLADRHSLPFP